MKGVIGMLNYYDRQAIVNHADDREKINLIHQLIQSLGEHSDVEKFDEYFEHLRKADQIYTERNEFYL